jgi:hypothetical protein
MICCVFFMFSSLGLLDMLNDSYIDSVDDLPIASGSPSIKWQQSRNIRAWIDIVGFKNMAYINRAYYVPGNPADYAIVQSDAQAVYLCSWCVVVSLKKTVSISDQENLTTAILRVELHYNEVITNCDDSGCWYNVIPHTETATFKASEVSPLIYDATKERVQVSEVNYNHSLYAEKLIYVNTSNLITRYIVTTSKGSVLHRLDLAQIDYTNKNVPYANYSAFDTWEVNGTNISYQYKAAVLDDVSSTYSIQAYSPFGPVNNVSISTSEKIWTPENAISSFTFLIIFIVSVAFFGISKMR